MKCALLIAHLCVFLVCEYKSRGWSILIMFNSGSQFFNQIQSNLSHEPHVSETSTWLCDLVNNKSGCHLLPGSNCCPLFNISNVLL